MYLYDINEKDYLDIYTLEAKKEDLTQFKIEQMKKIPEKNKFFSAHTTLKFQDTVPLFEDSDIFNEKISCYYADNPSQTYCNPHWLTPVIPKKDIPPEDNFFNTLLYYYYTGSFDKREAIQILYKEKSKYFLLTDEKYEKQNKQYKMDRILQIPESLYILQKFEQESFSPLKDKDISEVLELYSLSQKLDTIDLNEIQKAGTYGIMTGAYQKAHEKAEKDKYVLQLVKK